MMDVFVARQAIMNRRNNVVAYELFFRDGPNNVFPKIDAHEATSKLIARTHFNKGISPVTYGKRALINFSEESILKRVPHLLPRDEIIIEVLETVTPSDEVYQACAELYRAGYTIALDDFVYKPEWFRFLKLTKLLKFDIMATPLDKIAPLIVKLRDQSNIKLLAEKVESEAEYKQAKALGFHFFQGYYFAKPEMHKSRTTQSNEHLLMLLYREAVKPELNYKAITNLLEKDSSLTYKLLCYINSGSFPLKTTISSVKQALTYLGDSQLRNLLSLFVTAILASKKPLELANMCIIRAKFCELIAQKVAPSQSENAFLAGLFSLLDAILDSDMESVLSRIPVSEEISEVLLDKDDKCQSTIAISLRVAKLLEQGHWHLTQLESQKLNLEHVLVDKYYTQAIKWADIHHNIGGVNSPAH